jgi:hypothetical protein
MSERNKSAGDVRAAVDQCWQGCGVGSRGAHALQVCCKYASKAAWARMFFKYATHAREQLYLSLRVW